MSKRNNDGTVRKQVKQTVFNNVPKHILASILQYLTINELNIMSKMSRYILETILQYRLKERRTRVAQEVRPGPSSANTGIRERAARRPRLSMPRA